MTMNVPVALAGKPVPLEEHGWIDTPEGASPPPRRRRWGPRARNRQSGPVTSARPNETATVRPARASPPN